MRIDKFISSQKPELSRSDVKKLVRDGHVTLNGKPVKNAQQQANEDDDVRVNGERIFYREHIYIMLNKPQGYICSTSDNDGESVLKLLPSELRRPGLFPAGRLDKDTEGFVLITDDGELAHKMLAPSHHVPKTYQVTLERPFDESYIKLFAEGITIDGGEKCLPAEVTPDVNDCHKCTLILHEGKYHQVKRMFISVGNKVTFLRRTRIGNLQIDENLPLGGCLEILHKDVDKFLF